MMKLNSNRGVTLVILIVVIIVVIILLGIIINKGTNSVNESVDEQFKSELYIVQQAIYQKQKEYEINGNSTSIIGDEISLEKLENYDENKRIKQVLNTVKINGNSIFTYDHAYKYDGNVLMDIILSQKIVIDEQNIDRIESFTDFYMKKNNQKVLILDKQYYALSEEHLKELGLSGIRIKNSKFVVNYETGEVYNCSKKYYSNEVTPMYLPGYNKDEVTGEFKSDIIEIK